MKRPGEHGARRIRESVGRARDFHPSRDGQGSTWVVHTAVHARCARRQTVTPWREEGWRYRGRRWHALPQRRRAGARSSSNPRVTRRHHGRNIHYRKRRRARDGSQWKRGMRGGRVGSLGWLCDGRARRRKTKAVERALDPPTRHALRRAPSRHRAVVRPPSSRKPTSPLAVGRRRRAERRDELTMTREASSLKRRC